MIAGILAILLLTAYLAPLVLLQGWVATKIWAWHVLPMGVAPLGLGAAVGLLCLFRLGLGRVKRDKDKNSSFVEETIIHVAWPLLLLLMAYLGHVWG